jgi:hypothetical protein
MPWADTPYHLFASSIVYGGENKTRPFLFAQVCGAGAMSGDGDCGIANALYRYDKGADRFIRVFLNRTGRNNNQDTRFVESGPLQGDVIVGNPTENAPYTYWIEVYRAGDSGQYGRVLRYRGLTGYSDGNPLAVADSEMPEILHRRGNPAILCLFRPICLRDAVICLCGMAKNGASDEQGRAAC